MSGQSGYLSLNYDKIARGSGIAIKRTNTGSKKSGAELREEASGYSLIDSMGVEKFIGTNPSSTDHLADIVNQYNALADSADATTASLAQQQYAAKLASNGMNSLSKNVGSMLSETGAAKVSVDELTAGLNTNYEATLSNTFAAKAYTAALTVANITAEMFKSVLMSIGVGLVVSAATTVLNAVWTAVDENLLHRTETLISKSDEAMDAIENASSTYASTKETVNGLADSYARLAQGVNQVTGANLTLSDNDYAQYIEYNNELAELFPDLVSYYDANGNAVLTLKGNVDTLTSSLKALIEQARLVALTEIASNSEAVYNGAIAKKNQAQDNQYDVEDRLSILRNGNGGSVEDTNSWSLESLETEWQSEVDAGLDAAATATRAVIDARYQAIEDAEEELKGYQEDEANAWSDYGETMGAILNTDPMFDGVEQDVKDAAQQFLKNANYGEFNSNDEWQAFLKNTLAPALKDDDIAGTIETLFTDGISSMSPGAITALQKKTLESIKTNASIADPDKLYDMLINWMYGDIDYSQLMERSKAIYDRIISSDWFYQEAPVDGVPFQEWFNNLSLDELQSFISFYTSSDGDFVSPQDLKDQWSQNVTVEVTFETTGKELMTAEKDGLDQYLKDMDAYQEAISGISVGTYTINDAFSLAEDHDSLLPYITDLQEFQRQVKKLRASETTAKLVELRSQLADATAAGNTEAVDYLNAMIEWVTATNNGTEAILSLSSAVDQYTTSLSTAVAAEEEMITAGRLASSTVSSIISELQSAGLEPLEYLYADDNGIQLDTENYLSYTLSAYTDKLNKAKQGIQDAQNKITEVVSNGTVNGRVDAETFQAASDDLANYVKQVEVYSALVSEATFEESSSNYDSYVSSMDTFASTLTSLHAGTLELSDVMDLITQYPKLAKYVDLTSDSFDGLEDALYDMMETEPDTFIARLNKVLETNTDLTDTDRAAIQALADAADELADKYSSWYSSESTLNRILEDNASKWTNCTKAVQDYQAAIANISTEENYDAYSEAVTQMYEDLQQQGTLSKAGWGSAVFTMGIDAIFMDEDELKKKIKNLYTMTYEDSSATAADGKTKLENKAVSFAQKLAELSKSGDLDGLNSTFTTLSNGGLNVQVDGSEVDQLAEKLGITSGFMESILQQWEDLGLMTINYKDYLDELGNADLITKLDDGTLVYDLQAIWAYIADPENADKVADMRTILQQMIDDGAVGFTTDVSVDEMVAQLETLDGFVSDSSVNVEKFAQLMQNLGYGYDETYEWLQLLANSADVDLDFSSIGDLAGYLQQIFSTDTSNAAVLEGLSSEKLEEYQELYEEYQAIVNEAEALGIDLSNTVYGNIDTNNRQVLEWTGKNLAKYQSAIESWGSTVEELRGSFSTVFGTSAEFDGIEIAFSPILQTENGAVLLDKDTVYEYIYGLIDKAGENWSSQDLLALDAEGLELDGQYIQGLLADIGDTARQTGEAMHFTGDTGAVAEAYSALLEAADEAGVSVEDLMSYLEDLAEKTADPTEAQETYNDAVQVGIDLTEELDGVSLSHLKNQLNATRTILIKASTAAETYRQKLAALNNTTVRVAVSSIASSTNSGGSSFTSAHPTAEADGSSGVQLTQTSLVGELGPEMVVDRASGTWHLVGENGAEFVTLHRGDIVFDAQKTRQLLARGWSNYRGQALVDGTSGPAYAYSSSGTLSSTAVKNATTMKKSATTSKSSSSSSSSTTKDQFEKEQKYYEHLRDMELITDREYYEALYKLNEKYYAGVSDLQEEYWSTQKELYEGMKSMLSDSFSVQEHEAELLSRQKGTTSQIVSIYKDMMDQAHEAAEWYRARGVDEDSETIRELESKWWDYYDKMKEAKQSELEESIAISKHQMSLIENNQGTTSEAIAEEISIYQDMMKKTHETAEWYRALGVDEDSDTIRELQEQWWEYYDAMEDKQEEWADFCQQQNYNLIDALEYQLELLKQVTVYSGTTAVSTTDNTSDIITNLTAQQMAYFAKINEADAEIARLMAAGYKEWSDEVQAAEKIKREATEAITQLDSDKVGTALSSINDFISNADAFDWWDYFDYSELDTYARKIEMINEALENGLLTSADYYERLIEAAEEYYNIQKDAVDTILELTEEMIKQEVNDHIDALKDEVTQFKKIVSLKKESLKLTEQETDYNKTLRDKLKEIAKIEEQLNLLELDDSREATAKKKELAEELADLQEELADYQSDYSTEAAQDALDKQADAFSDAKEEEEKEAKKTIESTEKVYQLAIARMKEDGDSLYQELIDYNYEYGSKLESVVTSAWDSCKDALKEYQYDYEAMVKAISTEYVTPNTEFTDMSTVESGSTSYSKVADYVQQMKDNSAEWKTRFAAGESKASLSYLNTANQTLAAQIGQILGVTPLYNSDTGEWYLNGQKLYSIYHDGGVVGTDMKGDELMARLQKNEWVLNEEQQSRLTSLFQNGIVASLQNIFTSGTLRGTSADSTSQIKGTGGGVNIDLQVSVDAANATADAADAIAQKTADAALTKLKDAFAKRGISNVSFA
jgi:hypothetical protein